MKKLSAIALLTAWFYLCLLTPAEPQTVIYRSCQINKTSALATGAGNNLTISASTATFASALPDSIGVGDCIQYDDDNDGDIDANDSVCFIHGRTSSTVYTVKNAAGAAPTATAAADQDWSIFRSYINHNLNEAGTENTGIDVDVSNFDAGSRDIVANNEQWHFACYRGQLGGGMVFDTWTTGENITNPNNYVRFYAPYLATEVGTSQRHAGKFTNANAMACTGPAAAASIIFGAGAKRIILEGLVINVSTTGNQIGLLYNGAAGVTHEVIRDCIIRGQSAGTGVYAIRFLWTGVGTDIIDVYNCIIYDMLAGSSIGILMNGGASDTLYAYNNTISDITGEGINMSSGQVSPKNNLILNTSGNAFTSSTWTRAENNATDDATAPGTNSRINQTFTFENEASDNFLLASNDAGARKFGKNLSTDAFIAITTDILNTTRTVSWDIGAHEVSTVADATASRRRWIVQSMLPNVPWPALLCVISAISIIGIAIGLYDTARRERLIKIANTALTVLQLGIVVILIVATTPIALPIILILEKFGIIEKER